NRVAGDIGGRKKREPPDVIPEHMGNEKMIDLGFPWTVLAHDVLSKPAQPPAPITHPILGRVPHVPPPPLTPPPLPRREIQFLVNEALDSCLVVETSAIGLQERLLNFATHSGPRQGDRNGAAGSPKTYKHSSSGRAEGVSLASQRQQRSQAQDIPRTLA